MGLVAPILILAFLASSFVKSYSRIRLGDDLIEKTSNKLQKMEEENKNLAEQLEMVKSEEYREKQFRDKMGLVKDGEIVVVLPEAEELRKLVPDLPVESEPKLKPNWQKWLELFN